MKFVSALLFLSICFFTACSKDSDPNFDISQQQNTLIGGGTGSGSSSSQTTTTKTSKWKITALFINNVQQTLGASQLTYQKQYDNNGKYADTDGIVGTWSIPVKDSLVEVYTNYPSGAFSQGYKITNLSTTEMTLNYKISTTNVTTVYKIVN